MNRYYSYHDRWGCTGPCTWIYSCWSLHYAVCGFYTNYPKVSEVGSVEFKVWFDIFVHMYVVYCKYSQIKSRQVKKILSMS